MRAFMVMYGSFWSPAAHCIVLEAYLVAGSSFQRVTLGGPVCELIRHGVEGFATPVKRPPQPKVANGVPPFHQPSAPHARGWPIGG